MTPDFIVDRAYTKLAVADIIATVKAERDAMLVALRAERDALQSEVDAQALQEPHAGIVVMFDHGRAR